MDYIANGFPENLPDHPRTLKPYWRYKEAFYITDGVLMYNDRIVVPPSLHQQVLSTLHHYTPPTKVYHLWKLVHARQCSDLD